MPLLRASLDSQEEITEALGVQVRQAVELLVAAIGRADVRDREARRRRPATTSTPTRSTGARSRS